MPKQAYGKEANGQSTLLVIGYDVDRFLYSQYAGRAIFRHPEDVTNPEHIGHDIRQILVSGHLDESERIRIKVLADMHGAKYLKRGGGLTSLREALKEVFPASSEKDPPAAFKPLTLGDIVPKKTYPKRELAENPEEKSELQVLRERIIYLEGQLATALEQNRELGERYGKVAREEQKLLKQAELDKGIKMRLKQLAKDFEL